MQTIMPVNTGRRHQRGLWNALSLQRAQQKKEVYAEASKKEKTKIVRRKHRKKRIEEKMQLDKKSVEHSKNSGPNNKKNHSETPITPGQKLMSRRISSADNANIAATNAGLQKAARGSASWKDDPEILQKLVKLGIRSHA